MLSVFDKNLKNLVLRLAFLAGLMISSPLMAPVKYFNGAWQDDKGFRYDPSPNSPLLSSQAYQDGRWYNENGTLAQVGEQYQASSYGRPQQQPSGGAAALSAPSSTVQFTFQGRPEEFGTFLGSSKPQQFASGDGGWRPSSSGSSSLPQTQSFGLPSSGGGFGGGAFGGPSSLTASQSFLQSSSLSRPNFGSQPNYSSTFQSGGGLAQFAPQSSAFQTGGGSLSYPQNSFGRPSSPLTASSLQQFNQGSPASPVSMLDPDGFSSIGDGTESNVPDLGDDVAGQQQQQRPALQVSKLASKQTNSVLAPFTAVPQRQGAFDRLFNSNQDSVIKSIQDSNAKTNALLSREIDPNNKDKYFTFRGKQIARADADAMINAAEGVNQLLRKMVDEYKNVENLYNDISGKLVSYVEKQRLNAEATFKDFMSLFEDDRYAVGYFKDPVQKFELQLNGMFQQVLAIYEDIATSNSTKIKEMNDVLAAYSIMTRELKEDAFEVLKLKEARTAITNFFDAASRFVNK